MLLISCPPEDTTNAPAALERCLSSVSCNTSTTLDPKSALACRRELRPDDSSLCRASYVLFSGGGDQRLLNTGDTTRNRARRGLTNLLPSQWNRSEIQIFLLNFFFFFPFFFCNWMGGTQPSTAVANWPGDVAEKSKFNAGCLTPSNSSSR